MEIDHLKNLWNKENIPDVPEISLEQQKEIHLPLERIRKNMRVEFWSTVVMFLLIIAFMILKDMYFFKFKVYVITLVSSMMLVTAFYFFKFFSLYKNLTTVDLNTAESLRELAFQFKLNEQYYSSFYIAFVPFVICEMLLIFEYVPRLSEMVGVQFVLFFLASCSAMLVLLFLFGKWWFQRYYGKYIEKISTVIVDLK